MFSSFRKTKNNPDNFRKYNFTKNEPILNQNTVQYQLLWFSIPVFSLSPSIWPTALIIWFTNCSALIFKLKIATAVFIRKYLISMGFHINNEWFKDHVLYFRNALVRANYTNYSVSVKETKTYLIKAFWKLIVKWWGFKHIKRVESLCEKI